jgi:hypothetical protein
MTFYEIVSRESQSQDSVCLYREGMFMKAYERSAFFAYDQYDTCDYKFALCLFTVCATFDYFRPRHTLV